MLTDTHNLDLAALIGPVRRICAQASGLIRGIYGTSFNVAEKSDHSPVTDADLASHRQIVTALRHLTPEIPVISEEGEVPAFDERCRWPYVWLVDPLDGTREFIKRSDHFTVNVALIAGTEPVLGVIDVPMLQRCYFAFRWGGAFRVEAGQRPVAIRTRAWAGGGPVTVAGSRSHRSERFQRFLANFSRHELIIMGSSLKSCLVAEGRADIYIRFGDTSEWDTAAAQCIVTEAGGGLVDLQLRPLRYNARESLINPPFLAVGDLTHDWRRYLPE